MPITAVCPAKLRKLIPAFPYLLHSLRQPFIVPSKSCLYHPRGLAIRNLPPLPIYSTFVFIMLPLFRFFVFFASIWLFIPSSVIILFRCFVRSYLRFLSSEALFLGESGPLRLLRRYDKVPIKWPLKLFDDNEEEN